MMRQNISKREIECKCGCGLSNISPAVLDVVQQLRNRYGKPVIINSACRCMKHNKEVGGKQNSKHLCSKHRACRAIDFKIADVPLETIYNYLEKKYPFSLGIGIYNTFIHVDDRQEKAFRWDNRGVK